MTYRPAPVSPGAAPAPAIPARLEPDAIGVTQDVVIGTANAAPAVAVALTLAPLAAAAAYGSGPVIIMCGLPMLIIANSYRRLNLWKANCDASFEWVGHVISPYLGFLTGWLGLLFVPAGQRTVTCAVCQMTHPSPERPCRPGWDHRLRPPEAGCPGCSRLTAVCARGMPCQARRSLFGWQLARLRFRQARLRLRPRRGPSCCGMPGRCVRVPAEGGVPGEC